MKIRKAKQVISKALASSRSSARSNAIFEPMEKRVLMSTTIGPVTPSLTTEAESTKVYDTNSYMGVGLQGGYYDWGFLEYGNNNPSSSATPPSGLFGQSGVSNVSSVSIALDNTATSGRYAPVAGTFDIYVLPSESFASGNVRYAGSATSTVGLGALSTTNGGETTLGLPGDGGPMDATYEVGSFTITSGLPSGYTTFTGSTTGSTTSDTTGNATGSTDVLGVNAAATIASDINNGVPVRFAIVGTSSSFFADWEGNYKTGGTAPTLALTYNNQLPEVAIAGSVAPTQTAAGMPVTNGSAGTINITENDKVAGNSTTAVITVNNTGSTANATTVNYTLSNQSNATITSPLTGSVTIPAGSSSATFNVSFGDITAEANTGSVVVTLTDPGTNGTPVLFPTGGNTTTVVDTYLQGQTVQFDAANNYSINENAGTATFTIDRTFSGGQTTGNASVVFNTFNGTPYSYSAGPQSPQDAEAGRDYTTTTQTVNFTGSQTTATVTVPILDVPTFAGTRYFNIALLNPSTGAQLGLSNAQTVAITDNAVSGDAVVTGTTSDGSGKGSSGIETSGPYYTDSFLPLVSQLQGSFGYATFPEVEFNLGAGNLPSTPIGPVQSLTLSVYNTATTGGYGGVAGNFDIYALTNPSGPTTGLAYAATGDTGASVLSTSGDQAAGPVYLGTAYFPNNQVGYNDYTVDNISSAVGNTLAQLLDSGSPLRLALIPSSGSSVAADLEGNFTKDQPMISILAGASANNYENFSVSASDSPTKGATTETITVTRSALAGGDLNDTASVSYNTSDGTAVAGNDYTATTGVLNFAANQTSATITVPLLDPTSQHGDKYFNVNLFSPTANMSNGTTYVGLLGSPSTETVDIVDSTTIDTYGQSDLVADIEATGPYNAGKYLDVAGTGNTYPSFGVADFNDTAQSDNGGGEGFNLPSNNVGTINELTLYTVNAPDKSVSGPVDVYLVSNYSASLTTGTSLAFNTSDPSGEGLAGQLGTTYLLGQVNYSASQSANGFTALSVTGSSPSTLAILAYDLNNNLPFRFAFTPESSSVNVTWAGNISATAGGSFNNTLPAANGQNDPNSDLEEPILGINYSPAVSGSIPAWLSLAPGATVNYSSSADTLEVTSGTASIVDDPGKSTYGQGAVAITVDNGATLDIAPAAGNGNAVHIGTLSIASGAHAAITATPTTGTPNVLFIAGTNGTSGLTISGGTLDIANNDLDVANGALPAVDSQIKLGYNGGLWNGASGIISTSAPSSHYLEGIGAINNVNGTGVQLYQTFDGQTAASTDVLVRYTYVGDANLDGRVDGSDYANIDSAFNFNKTHLTNPLTGWFNGDFNYDGAIDGSDYTLLDNVFNTQGTPLAGPTAQVAAQIATPTSSILNTATSSNPFSNKKVHKLIDLVLQDLVTSK